MFHPFVSIVIPFYNREKTLPYCIESVMKQSYGHWELLLIDDGSTDHSAEICKSYCKEDDRIKYYFQDNQGAGPARNQGIKEAKGEWITFVDSDDAILSGHLAQLQKYGEGSDCVMVNRCRASYENGKLVKIEDNINGIHNVKLVGNKEIIDFLYGDFDPYSHANYACWDKFFKMSIIRKKNVRYPLDVPTGQDQVFVVSYLKHINNFYLSREGTYAQTPMGNEGIDHLACKLRTPEEFLHCQIANYNALMELAYSAGSDLVREYAVNYILKKPLLSIIIPYTKWRNRKKTGKRSILCFIRHELLPIARKHENEMDFLKDEIYREYWRMILNGQDSELYDYLYIMNLKKDILSSFRRRWNRLRH